MAHTAASIALHAVVFPSLSAIENQDPSSASAVQAIRVALEKAEAENPGLTHELVDFILESEQSKGGVDSIERLLRISAQDIDFYRVPEKTPELKGLVEKSKALKVILAGIPDQITDRTKFLSIIRDIASCIKEMLDAVNLCCTNNEALLASQKLAIEQQKKNFVRGSKSFSDTLKRYFKEGRSDHVFRSAHRLINLTNSLLRIIRTAVSA